MIGEAVVVAGIGATILTIADKENLFQNNPEKRWFWERVQWPWAVTRTPSARYSPIQRPIQPTPQQQLRKAETEILYAQQIVNGIRATHPELSQTKYRMTS